MPEAWLSALTRKSRSWSQSHPAMTLVGKSQALCFSCRCSAPSTTHRRPLRSSHATAALATAESSSAAVEGCESFLETSRRGVLGSVALLAAGASVQSPAQAAGATGGAVGGYLPKKGVDDLVEFIPDGKKTPSLRSGQIDAASPYKFAIPPSWKEERVANIQSGNFCAPRCDEPWTEVIFQSPAEGKIQLLVSPLRRLTNKAKATISEVGPPETVLQAVGPFLTGVSAPEEEEVVSTKTKDINGRQYYHYECNSLAGQTGPHILASVTTKGDQAYVLIVSANEKQWGKSKGKLQKVLDTFEA